MTASIRLLIVLCFAALAAFAQTSAHDLSWIAGTWMGDKWGGSNTETWTAPNQSGEMFGAYRFVKDGKPVFYELLAIEIHDGKPLLVMRHFNRGLVAWEEKDAALRFSVQTPGPKEAVFQQIFPEGKNTKLRYWQQSPDTLNIELITVKDGKESKELFFFRKQG